MHQTFYLILGVILEHAYTLSNLILFSQSVEA